MYKLRISYKINCSYQRDGKNKPLVREDLDVIVTVKSKELKRNFVAMEHAVLNKIFEEKITMVFDGKFLNDFFGIGTSLDYFARDIAQRIDHELPTAVEIDSVVLRTLDKTEIEYTNGLK